MHREYPKPPPLRRHPETTPMRLRRMVAVEEARSRREEMPFDPEAPREHYAQPHHFAVNAKWTRKYIDELPDSAFLYVAKGGRKSLGSTHPLSLRMLPYKNHQGQVDEAHLRAALGRINQPKTNIPDRDRAKVFAKAQRIYGKEFGRDRAKELAANSSAAYHVFEMSGRGTPIREVTRGALTLGSAKQLARIGATEGKHDRAVTTSPSRKDFRIVAAYEHGTGRKL